MKTLGALALFLPGVSFANATYQEPLFLKSGEVTFVAANGLVLVSEQLDIQIAARYHSVDIRYVIRAKRQGANGTPSTPRR